MSEQTLHFISEIFNVCIIPLLGVAVAYLVKFIQAKSKELQTQTNNEIAKKYIQMVTTTVTSCVIATNQTYVDSLKKQGQFNEDAQQKAFQDTLNAVLAILSDDAKEYLTAIYGDLNVFLTQQIEATVKQYKDMTVY